MHKFIKNFRICNSYVIDHIKKMIYLLKIVKIYIDARERIKMKVGKMKMKRILMMIMTYLNLINV